jgi:DsbC/DsbD-like thiol-disulfide interchange protein
MAIMLRIASAVIFSILSLVAAAAQPLKASSTNEGFHSRARLIAGGRQGDAWLAGIEITLDPGFKTYWRNPGDSGLPPRFDWSGSENAADIDLRWPAPERHEDAAGVAYAYDDKVVLPVLVKAKEPGKPIRLAVTAEYGVCRDICIPAHADLSLDLTDSSSDRPVIEAALATVPVPLALGTQADLSVLSVEPQAQDKTAFSVAVRAPAGEKPELFAEGPDNWYFSTSLPDAANRFTVKVEEKPRDASGPVPLRLTLVAGDKAIETEVSLDANGQAR